MKNKLKKVLPILLLFLVPLTIFAATQWRGSGNVDNIKDNLALIQIEINKLKDAATNEDGQTIEQIEKLLKNEKELRRDKEDEIEGLLAEIEELKQTQNASGKEQKIKDLEAEVETLKTEKAQLTTNISGLNKQIKDLADENTQLNADKEELQKIIDNHDDNSDTINELNAKIATLEAKNLTLTSDKKALEDDNIRLAGENTNLSAELDQALRDVQEIEAMTQAMLE